MYPLVALAGGALVAGLLSRRQQDAAAGLLPIDQFASRLRADFPVLACPYVYLDSASTTPKPRAVIEAVLDYYTRCTANVHRAVHGFGQEATRLYDQARSDVAVFINAKPTEVIFVRGATEAINIVAGTTVTKDDEVIFPASEHHANYLPWRVYGKAVLVPVDTDGVPQWEALEGLITPRTKLIAFAHASNVTGCVAPVAQIVAVARKYGVPVLLDAAQSFSHMPIDVQALGVDYLAASSHKAFGPSGVGILWGREDRLQNLPPALYGGGMVQHNTEYGFTLRDLPLRMEAGTPAIEAAIGFGAAIRWMQSIGMQTVRDHDRDFGTYLTQSLCAIPGVRVLGAGCADRIALASFTVGSRSSTDLARQLDTQYQVCVSAGLHCAHVLHGRAGVTDTGTVRASAHVFNTTEDVDRLVNAVRALVS